jgi:hypothetical protein
MANTRNLYKFVIRKPQVKMLDIDVDVSRVIHCDLSYKKRVRIRLGWFRMRTSKSFVNTTMNLDIPYDRRTPVGAQDISTFK